MEKQGCVIWFTGLSGSGKSTTARELYRQWQRQGLRAEMLDGDELRETICKGLGFSREDRMENIRRIVYVAKLLARSGVHVIVSAITPYKEMREYARSQIPGYVEIYVRCTLQECERRDVKGLYAKARCNRISSFTGISDPYDVPERPDLTIDTVNGDVHQNVRSIMGWLTDSGKVCAKEGAKA